MSNLDVVEDAAVVYSQFSDFSCRSFNFNADAVVVSSEFIDYSSAVRIVSEDFATGCYLYRRLER